MATTQTQQVEKRLLGGYVPRALHEEFVGLARRNDRAVSAELRLAARRHLDAEQRRRR
jgi:hypothetical protein